jgi:predicted small lipoprotein YifL
MVPARTRDASVVRSSKVRSGKLALIAVALMGFTVAACGRVGPLDLPPGATADQAPNPKRGIAPDANQPNPAQKKPLPLDWLLN